jgi:hypothetical protein
VARKNFPMHLIITKATQAGAPFSYLLYTQTLLVTCNHSCRPFERAEIIHAISVVDGPNLLTLCICLCWEDFLATVK